MIDIEREQISLSQLFFLVLGFLLGSSVLLPPARDVRQDAWIAIILGAVESIIFISIYMRLAKEYPGKSLIGICNAVWGSYAGWAVSLLFLLYLLHLATLVTTNYVDFIQLAILPDTPSLVYTLALVGVCVLMACQGIEVIVRCAEFLIPIVSVLILTLVGVTMTRFNPQNLLPILNTPAIKLASAAHGVSAFPFGESIVFLMITPYVANRAGAKKVIVLGVLSTCILLVLVSARSIGVLGPVGSIFTYPGYSTSKFIELGEVLARIEIIPAFDFLVLGVFKITVLVFGVLMMLKEMLRLSSHKTFAVFIWLLISMIGVHNFRNNGENIEFAAKIYPLYALPFQLVIPLLTLLVASFKRKGGKGSESDC